MPVCNLTESDFRNLDASWITRELAKQALLRRVTCGEAAVIFGRNGRSDSSGVLFPYVLPGQNQIREYRLRRDHPDCEQDRSGRVKQKGKYLSPPGRSNLLYFVPGTSLEWLQSTNIPVAIVEGEKKALALFRLSWHETESPRFLPVGISGVWNWRGVIGKTDGPNGDRRDLKGPIPDLDFITWAKRRAYVVFDVDVRNKESVAAARRELSRELASRGAEVFWVNLPEVSGVNGVDDLLAQCGPEDVLSLFHQATPAELKRTFKNTDYGNAERIVADYGRNLRFCQPWKRWLFWNEKRWASDETGEVVRLAKATARHIYREAADIDEDGPRKAAAKWAHESERAERITAMVSWHSPNQAFLYCLRN